jgi:hypothetical protein
MLRTKAFSGNEKMPQRSKADEVENIPSSVIFSFLVNASFPPGGSFWDVK